MAETGNVVSSTRLYLGNLPREVTKEEIQEHFATHGTGKIQEIKLMNGFGFIEYDDAMDARDVVPDGTDLKGQRLTVQFARGPRPRDSFAIEPRPHPRPRRTMYRMQLTGLSDQTSWQDLKDFARRSGVDVVYSEVGRERDGRGFVEFETSADLKQAVDKLDNQEFKGVNVHCINDEQSEPPQQSYPGGGYGRGRSRSPPRRGGYPPPYEDYRSRGPPPRGYSPRRDYGRPPSPRGGYYDNRRPYSPGPRPMRGPPDDYDAPSRRRYHDDPYGPPPRGDYREPYPANGYGAPPPRRSPPPAHYGGYGRYEERPRHW